MSLNAESSFVIDVPFWTEEKTRELINVHGIELMEAVNSNGVPLLCDAILQQQWHSARLLLKLARDHESFVNIHTGNCPTLKWANERGSVIVAKFVLDSLVEKHLSMKESCAILKKYLCPLIDKFPKLIQDYLANDKFSFEYARFSVSRSIFEKNDKLPIAMMTANPLDDWTPLDSGTARELWINNSKKRAEDLKETERDQVNVIVKFFCVDLETFFEATYKLSKTGLRSQKHINLVEMLESETLKTLADWFYGLFRILFLLGVVMDLAAASAFTSFALLYEQRAIAIVLISASLLMYLSESLCYC